MIWLQGKEKKFLILYFSCVVPLAIAGVGIPFLIKQKQTFYSKTPFYVQVCNVTTQKKKLDSKLQLACTFYGPKGEREDGVLPDILPDNEAFSLFFGYADSNFNGISFQFRTVQGGLVWLKTYETKISSFSVYSLLFSGTSELKQNYLDCTWGHLSADSHFFAHEILSKYSSDSDDVLFGKPCYPNLNRSFYSYLSDKDKLSSEEILFEGQICDGESAWEKIKKNYYEAK